MKMLLVVAALTAPGLPPAHAGGAKGETPVNFLLMDGGARPAALGGAYVSLAPHSAHLGHDIKRIISVGA